MRALVRKWIAQVRHPHLSRQQEVQAAMQKCASELSQALAGLRARPGERLYTEAELDAAVDEASEIHGCDVPDGAGPDATCGCGEPITMYDGEWLHIFNPELRGTDDHDAEPDGPVENEYDEDEDK